MSKKIESAIKPTREENYPEWYQEVIKAAELAEASPVRGCMVIRPWGWGIWENVQAKLDRMFKETGHQNAYFPLFIPMSFLEKEASHVQGFAKECAVVTHHRLEAGPDGKLRPAPSSLLEEPLIVRPTSETIIGETYSKWVQSYRDLPILINQWANVVRWEMRPRLFLRTAEFLWQEGHTVHATAEEAMEETMKMLDVYTDFARNTLAIPVIPGEKTAGERFPGAVSTFTIEGMMQDRKALQMGTSHFLGQNFAKASNIKFQDKDGKMLHAWTTSWGVSTRLIGGVIMAHSDDDGLVLPPRVAPKQVMVVPIFREESEKASVFEYCDRLVKEINDVNFADGKVRAEVDKRDMRGGDKNWQHIKKGVPIRLEVGPRDMASDSVFMARRDKPHRDKVAVPREQFLKTVTMILDEIQSGLYERALARREAATVEINDAQAFEAFFTPKHPNNPEIHGGFALSHWAEDPALEAKLAELKVTIRCIPSEGPEENGKCLFSGKPSTKRAIFAKAY
jgi:prolyl-tRNA synthetase